MNIWFVSRFDSAGRAVAHQEEGQLFDAQVCELDGEYEHEPVSAWVNEKRVVKPSVEIKQVKEHYIGSEWQICGK